MRNFRSNNLPLISCAVCMVAILCFSVNDSLAQNRYTRSYIDYSYSWYNSGCDEGNTNEYTVNSAIWNDESGWCDSYNRQCNADLDCQNGTNACDRTTSANHDASNLYIYVQGWEDDSGPRNEYNCNSSYGNCDDCYGARQCGPYNITNYAINTWRTDVCDVGGDHRTAMRWIWNYVPVNQPSAFSYTTNCNNNYLNAISSNQGNVTWYWQGTNSNGTSTSNPSTSNYPISSNGTYYLRARGDRNGAWSSTRSVNVTGVQNTAGTASAYGNGYWQHSAYNGSGTWSPSSGEYKGYYTTNAQSFNSLDRWCSSCSPGDANNSGGSAYQGCSIGADQHTVVSRRTGFDCGIYRLDMPNHDDNVRVTINGINVLQHDGCCDAHNNFWVGYLDGSTSIEVVHREGGGGSHQSLTLVEVSSSFDGGSVTGGGTICSGGNLGTFGSSPPSLSGYTYNSDYNGKHYYISNSSNNNIINAQANAASHGGNVVVIENSAENSHVQSIVSGFGSNLMIGLYDGVIEGQFRWVNADPSSYTNWNGGEPNNAGSGEDYVEVISSGRWNDLPSFDHGGKRYLVEVPILYQWQSRPGTSGTFTNISGANSLTYNPPALNTTTQFRRARLTECGVAGGYSNILTITVVADPTSPTLASASPSSGSNVCAGSTVSANLNGGSGGTGCSDQYRYSTDGGTNWTSYSSGANITVGAFGTTTIVQGRRLCSGNGCDGSGETYTTLASWSVNDVTNPTINCPANTSVNTNSGCTYVGGFGTATGNDNCGGVSISNNAGSSLGLGANVVVWTATDGSGNTRTCNQTVTVNDDDNPTITCPSNATRNTNSGCTYVGGLGSASGSDNCSYTISNNAPSALPLGNTTVTWTATDGAGNAVSCNQNVTVSDDDAPSITCPATANVTTNVGCSYSGAIGNASATDNCGTATITNNAPTGPTASYPLGNSTVVWTATDAAGNSASCNQTISVTDDDNPTITCTNYSKGTNSGCTYVGAVGDPAASDNCGSVTLSGNAPAAYPLGATTVTWTATDAAGNTATCNQIVTVVDDDNPTISCPATATVGTNSGCTYVGSIGTATTTDNCGATVSNNAPASFGLGNTTVTWTATDAAGNAVSCNQTVTVSDDDDPVITCPAGGTTYTNTGCTYVGPIGTASATDNCGATVSSDAPAALPLGTNVITWTATDAAGNTDNCTQTVTILDGANPNALCQNVTVQLDASGNGSTTAAAVNNGSNDNCGIQSITLSQTAFDCDQVGGNAVTLTVTDNSGNVSTCTATVTVEDNVSPNAICQDIAVQLDANGDASITTGQINNGSSDACDIANLALDITDFDCSSVGGNVVTLTVTDDNSNSSICTATVTVEDNIDPVILGGCPSDITTFNSAQNCNQLVSWDHPTTTDNCGIASTVFSSPGVVITDFGTSVGAFGLFSVGVSTVTYTVTDDNSNVSTCTFTITVEDNENPVITGCPSEINIGTDLGLCGAQAFWTAPTASDNCPGVVMTVNGHFSGQTYPIGTTTVTYTATDNVGLTTTCSFNIIVADDEDPVVNCPADVTVTADAGVCEATGVALGMATTSDNCPGETVSNDAPAAFPVGSTTVTWTATDAAGNTSSCTQVVTVTDDEDPTISCPANITQSTDANTCGAMVIYTVSGTDNCTGEIISITAGFESGETFPLGTTTNTYVITDAAGNTATCSFDVTIEDNESPNAVCQDVTVQLDASGNGGTTAAAVDNGSNDACGISDLSLSQTTFGCSEVGANSVTLTVTDNNSNVSTCTATVTVEDNVAPVAICQDVTVQLDASGNGSTTAAAVDNGSNDACGIQSLSLSQTTFVCGEVGGNSVTLTVTDNNDNVSTCTATVTVEDNVAPTAVCQDATIELDINGNASVAVGDINNGSNDACGILSTSLDNITFDCANVGANTVTLTVTDINDNVSTCTATVTVEDNISPSALCQNITVQLDVNGNVSILADDINSGSFDNCTGTNVVNNAIPWINEVNHIENGMDADNQVEVIYDATLDLNAYSLKLYIGDFDGNLALYNSVTLAQIDPNAVSIGNGLKLVVVDGQVALPMLSNDRAIGWGLFSGSTPIEIISWQGIDPTTTTVSGGYQVSHDVMYADGITDVNVNKSAGYTIISERCGSGTPPSLTNWSSTLNKPSNAGPNNHSLGVLNGCQTITATSGNNGLTLSIDLMDFDCSNVGNNTVTLTVTDPNNNSSVCSSTVTVEDNVAPVAICQDVTVQLDASGNGSTTAAAVDNGSNDACGIQSLALSQTAFVCSEIGANAVTLTVTDNNDNVSTCTATVTVEDNVAPVAICQDVTVQLDGSGNGNTTAAAVDNGSNDACGIQSLALSQTAFVCSEVGANTVTLTVTDNNDNVSTCTATVTVEDNVAPVATCQDVTVQLDATGNGSITTGDVNNGSSDACGIASITLDDTDFNCLDLEPTVVNSNDLFISEYIEGSSNNKCIEIFNNTGVAINLGSNNYNILVYFNGSTSAGSSINLTGTLNHGETYVVCHSSAASIYTSQADLLTGSLAYNGDDAVVLRRNTTILDVFGRIGQDPGSQWSAGGNSTSEQTLIRNANVTEGNTANASGFPSLGTEWTQYPQNYSELGSHSVEGTAGPKTVTLTVTDNNNNVSTCTATVTVEDNVAPVAICQDVTVQLDASGNGSTTAAAVDNGSNDACGIQSLELSQTAFICSEVGANTVTLTVTDNNDNVSTCTATVTVEDNVLPVAICQDVTVQLDASGSGSTTANAVDDGSNDACGIQSLALSQTDFVCSEVGANSVTLTVTDNNNNISTCTATVTVEDNVAPVASCQDVTVQLDASGNASITTADINNGSSDACGIAGLSLDDSNFDCSDVAVEVTIADLFISQYIEGSGNNKCIEIFNGTGASVDLGAGNYNLLIYFNGSTSPGQDIALSGVIAAGDVFVICNSSATSTFTALADQTSGSVSFNGDDAVVLEKGGSPIDIFGRIGQDPGAYWSGLGGITTQNQTLIRKASVTSGNIDNASNFPSLGTEWDELPEDDASGLGSHTVAGGGVLVTLTVTDNNNNVSTCTATVTVEDNVDPVAICQDVTVQLDASGNGSTTAAAVDNGSNDACGIQSLSLSQTDFVCSEVGANTVTLTVTDNNDNVSTCTATVTVEDNVAPVAICQDVTVQLDASGNGSTTAAVVDNGSNDACGIQSLALSQTAFVCSEVGANTVTLTVTDNNDNVSTCTATVTVEDNVAPVAICQDVTVQLDASGNGSTTAAAVDNGSNDACGIQSLALSQTAFVCSEVGANTVTLTVTDNNNNVSTCTATVTVEDNVAPVAICQDVTVQLDASGNGSTTAAAVDNGSNDACGIQSLALSQTAFVCSEVGGNTVTLTVTDNYNNVSTCTATVTVEDNVAPVAICQDVTVQLDDPVMVTVEWHYKLP
ncbi:MAG: HYR domain-containing protein [Chitinophagales bacterium]